jgi:hypothetical protein
VHVGLLECASKPAPKTRVSGALNWGVFEFRSYIYFSKEKSSELVDEHRRKMSPNLGDFFSEKVFLGSTYANVPISTFRSPMKHSWEALEFF